MYIYIVFSVMACVVVSCLCTCVCVTGIHLMGAAYILTAAEAVDLTLGNILSLHTWSKCLVSGEHTLPSVCHM